MTRAGLRSKALAGLLALSGHGLLSGAVLACQAEGAERVRVSAVSAHGDLRLADGRTVRLAGINWPERARARERERLAAAVQAHVLAETAGMVVRGAADRWGRLPVDLFVLSAEGRAPLWVQGELAEDGMALIWPEAASRPCWAALAERETLGRQARAGVWSALARRPLRSRLPVELRVPISGRVVYEGEVFSVRKGRSVTFVNFAGPRASTPSWLIDRKLAGALVSAGRDPATFAGKRLVLRAEYRAQPRLTLTVSSPEAVDVIE